MTSYENLFQQGLETRTPGLCSPAWPSWLSVQALNFPEDSAEVASEG